MREQVLLNQRIVASDQVDGVLSEVASAREEGIPLNSVNLATALHRVARCGNTNVFRRLPEDPLYTYLLEQVSSRLQSLEGADFRPREIANTAWGVAKAGIVAPDVLRNLCAVSLKSGLGTFKPQELSICVWACSTSCNQCTPAQRAELMEFIPEFFASVEREVVRRSREGDPLSRSERGAAAPGLGAFKPQELSNTLWSFATVQCQHPEIFAVIAEEMLVRGVAAYVPQDIANSVWAFVTAGEMSHDVLTLVEEDVKQRGLRCFKSQELANLVWALAKADHAMTSFLDLVEQDILQRDLASFMPQELSNLLWSFATAGRRSDLLFTAVEAEILARGMVRFKSQELANTAWAFAKTSHEAPELFDALQVELLTNRDLQSFIPQELSNLLWSYAKLGYASPKLFRAMSNEMLRRGLASFKTQELSNAVWAHATTGQGYPQLFVAVEREALSRGLAAFSPQDLANMVWAFGKADHVAAILFEHMKSEFDAIQVQCGSLDLFKAQELSNLLWACAKTQHSAKLLFSGAESQALEVLARMEGAGAAAGAAGGRGDESLLGPDSATIPLEVSDEMWQFARVGQCADEMFEKLEHEILQRDLSEFATQHFANIAWAYVFLKFSRFHRLSRSGNRLLAAVLNASEARLSEFSLEELRQLGQVILATRQRGTREVGFAKKVHERLRREHLALHSPASSDFHMQVSEMLTELGVVHHNEVKVFEGVYHIDVVVGAGNPLDPAGKIAIEVDGPTHFVANSHQPTPHTSLKRWLLQREGYVVMSVPYFEWGPLQSDGVAMAYLEMQLESVGWDMEKGRLRDDHPSIAPLHGPFDEDSADRPDDEEGP